MRALLRADRADDELAKALARAGLYVERVPGDQDANLARPDVALVDPRLLPAGAEAPPRPRPREGTLEELAYERLSELLDRLGDERLPHLHGAVVEAVERALLRVALERKRAVGEAAELLGLHRNTLVRRLEALGLRKPPRRAPRRRGKR